VVAHPPAGLLLPALGSAWAADRYSQKGAFFDLLGRGVSRIFSRDLRRECAVESASFLSGYLLGLPCCALAPTAETALQMLAEGNRAGCWLSREAPDRIVDRLLVWILSAAGLAEAMRRDGTLTADAEAQEMLRVVAAESAVAARELLAAAVVPRYVSNAQARKRQRQHHHCHDGKDAHRQQRTAQIELPCGACCCGHDVFLAALPLTPDVQSACQTPPALLMSFDTPGLPVWHRLCMVQANTCPPVWGTQKRGLYAVQIFSYAVAFIGLCRSVWLFQQQTRD